jgi:hypothetical protein
MRNLEAVLAIVDRAHPDQSPLLSVPRKSHGGMSGPIFGPRQEQAFKHLVDWVALVAPSETPPPAADATENVEAQKAVRPVQRGGKTDGESAATSQPQTLRQFALRPDSAKDDDSSKTLGTPHKLQVGSQLKAWRPRDAFDPEIFNRAQQARQGQANPPAAQNSTRESATTAERR